jgi:hypothetical protein
MDEGSDLPVRREAIVEGDRLPRREDVDLDSPSLEQGEGLAARLEAVQHPLGRLI